LAHSFSCIGTQKPWCTHWDKDDYDVRLGDGSGPDLSDNAKAHLFFDYAHRKRVKIWGEARVVEGNDKLIAALMPESYRARPEQVILFRVLAWDANCPQHIPQRFDADDVAAGLAQRDKRIADLEAEVAQLRESAGTYGPLQTFVLRCRMSAFGVKRTRRLKCGMSANDPKRTFTRRQSQSAMAPCTRP
jgi:hypothetical protein